MLQLKKYLEKICTSFSNHWSGRATLLSAFLKYFLLGNAIVILVLALSDVAFIAIVKHTRFESHWNLIGLVAPWLILSFLLITSKIIWSCAKNVKYQAVHFTCKISIVTFTTALTLNILMSQGYLVPYIYLPDRIYADTYSKVTAIIDKSWITPRRIVIDINGGGNGEAAQAIAEKMLELNMDIEIKNFCGSACANFLFPAAHKKFLHSHAIVAYHGNITQQNLRGNTQNSSSISQPSNTEQNPSTDANRGTRGKEAALYSANGQDVFYINKIRSMWGFPPNLSTDQLVQRWEIKEAEFYSKLNVDRNLATYGQQGNYLETYKSYQYDGFYYSLEDLAAMGIKNIQLVDGNWHPEENSEIKKLYLVQLNKK